MTKTGVEIGIYLGAVTLAIGIFLPLAELEIVGVVNYYQVSPALAGVVLACVIVSTALMLMDRDRLILICLGGVWASFLYPLVQAQLQGPLPESRQTISEPAAEVLPQFAAEMFLRIGEFAWGGYVLLAGLACFTVSSLRLLRRLY